MNFCVQEIMNQSSQSKKMEHSERSNSDLPYDTALIIASFLPVRDVCALGCCSKFWRKVCGSDSIWVSLSRQRWPSLCLSDQYLISDDTKSHDSDPLFKDWRGFYIKRHSEMAGSVTTVLNILGECSSFALLELGHYHTAVKKLCEMEFSFKDVELILFKTTLNILLNFVGLQYCIKCLGVPAEDIIEALESCKISERQVYIKWWKLTRVPDQCTLRGESRSSCISLAALAASEDKEVLEVLHRDSVYDFVIKVKISACNPDEAEDP
ncbi:hypothetical protein Nepgr_030284 [Nepenthes gracilis]|uniref:F-box domain-containing protein n=1 Tax=Nepenthes gracilis TaxID=150966 RepID=A0AAD3Y6E7_NEPGR|nr:hypothetical protein Nepgr_030284 [Nepenthes gracilis]